MSIVFGDAQFGAKLLGFIAIYGGTRLGLLIVALRRRKDS